MKMIEERKSQGEGQGGCVQRIEVIVKRKKKVGWGCERISEAFVKIKKIFLGGLFSENSRKVCLFFFCFFFFCCFFFVFFCLFFFGGGG